MQQKGFTLIELLIVIAIIATLVSLATVSYIQAQKGARDTRRKSDLQDLSSALEQYYSKNQKYPASLSCTLDLDATYLPNGMLTDPKTGVGYNAVYGSNCTLNDYCFCAALEKETGNQSTGCTVSVVVPAGYKGFFCIKGKQ